MADGQNDLTFAAGGAVQVGTQEKDVLQELLSRSAMPSGPSGPLTSFGPQSIAPKTPTPFQMPQGAFGIPQGSFKTVGERKRADRQALFGGIAQIAKAGADKIQQNKTLSLQMDIERAMSAFDGYKEAAASGDKEAMAHNAAIINLIFSDPKKLKSLQKAFNIQLIPDGKNKNQVENKALYGAYKSYTEKQQKGETMLNPMAQAFESQMPQRLGLSPEMQAQASAIKADVIPGAKVSLEEADKNLRTLSTAQTNQDKLAVTQKLTQGLIDAKKYGVDQAYLRQVNATAGHVKATEITANAKIQVERENNTAAMQRLEKRDQELTDLAGINTKSRESIEKDKSLNAKEKAAKIATLNTQKAVLTTLGQRVKDIISKQKELDAFISRTETAMKNNPGIFSTVEPWKPGMNLNTWVKNRKNLEQMSKDVQSAITQRKQLDDKMKQVEDDRQKAMDQLRIAPLETVPTGSDSEPIDTNSPESSNTPQGDGGDINISFDLRDNTTDENNTGAP